MMRYDENTCLIIRAQWITTKQKRIHIDTFYQSLDEFGNTFRDRCLRMVKG